MKHKSHIMKALIIVFIVVVSILAFISTGWATPDADVEDIYTPTSLVALQTFVVTVELFNYGTDGTVPLNMYIDGYYQTTFYIPMVEWSYSWVDITVTGGLTAGYHTLMFCSSNCRTEGWTWTGTPDLSLSDIFDPTSLNALQDTTVTARISNNGNADAGAFYVSMHIDGSYAGNWQLSGLCAICYTDLSITITGGLTAGIHSIKFTADYYDDVWESSELNNERTESWTWSGTPDLELTDIYDPTSLVGGEDTTITARITNIGNADAASFWVAMYVDGSYINSWQYTGLCAPCYTELDITFTGGLVGGMQHSIRFVADEYNNVAESNEGNNERTESWTWSGTPDLEIYDIFTPTSLVSGEDTTITVRVTNSGNANAGPFWLDMYVDGVFFGDFDFTSGLGAWSSEDISFNITGGFVDGTHDIEFYADSFDEVAESNEANNNRIESFTWSGGSPDLELMDIYEPTSLVSGTDTIITAKLMNIGYADAGPFWVDMYIDGQFVIDFDFASGLSARTYTEIAVTITGGLVDGTHTIEFIADVLDEVVEANEANNNRIENWPWTGGVPDLELTDILDPTSLDAGEDTTIIAQITNIGYADAGPFWVDMFINGTYVISLDFNTGLPAWGAAYASVTITGGLPNGTYNIEFVADILDEVAESDEGNNNRIETFTWTGGVPDLAVIDIQDPTSLTALSSTTITFIIENIGYADAGPFFAEMYIDGNLEAYVDFSSGLPALVTGIVDITITDGLLAGTHYIRFVADTLNEVAESNESNNERTENWTWVGTGPSSCSSTYGSGIGLLGDIKGHIDICYDSGDALHYLKDLSRQAGLTDHSHIGQMNSSDAIETYHYDLFFDYLISDTDNIWDAPDQAAGVDGHVYAARVYDYLLDNSKGWSINSFDNNGSSMISIVEHTSSTMINNASWDGTRVKYGVGSGQPSFVAAFDVVAHEWGHAVTERVGANLYYGPAISQSGALNEAFSDWMGTTVEHYYGDSDWTIGEGVNVGRDLSNPPSLTNMPCQGSTDDPYPDDMSDYLICDNYSRHVHWNSSIPNKMFYLLSDGGTHPDTGITVQPIGIGNAMWIAAYANMNYWNVNSDFQDARDGMVNAASAITALGQYEINQIRNAWAAVGVGSIPVITTGASPLAGGTTSGDGSHEWGKSVTVTATPSTGYAFVDWTESSVQVSTSASYTFTVSGDRTLVANFVAIPIIFVNPASDDFGSYYVGEISPPRSFDVTNVGEAALDITSVSIVGADASDFAIYTDNCTGQSLAVSTGCTIQVEFSPTSPGDKNAVISIQSNDPADPVKDIYIYGTGMNNLPTADPGGPYSGDEGQSILLDGSLSDDVDGSIDLYQWDIDDDGLYDYTSTTPTQLHTYAGDGLYDVRLRVTDNDGGTNETATTTANIADTAPTACFSGSPTSGPVPLTVTFISCSTGYDQPLSYEWDFDNDSIIDSTLENPSFTYSSDETYSVTLTVIDSDGSYDVLTMTDYIVTLNNPPTANAAGPYAGIEGQPIILDGSGSDDTDGTITLYEWDIDNDGTYDYSSASPTQSHTYSQDGTYTIRLRVTDNDGATDTATSTANITDTAPTASFTGSPTSGNAPLTVSFTNSSTGYDTPLTYEWDFDYDGTVDSTSQNSSYTYNSAGTYTVELTVTDSDGSMDTSLRSGYITVTVIGNNPPTAVPGGPYSAVEGQSVTLDGSGSDDTDGTITLYEWDINNDGTYDYSSSSPTQSHTYAQNGTYTIKLRVTDDLGATDEATTTANIPDTSPTADFTGSPTSGVAPLTVNFTNNSTGYDQPLSYEWDFENNGSTDSTVQNPTNIYNNPGTYSVKLTVTDSDGSTDTLIRTDYITVTSDEDWTATGLWHEVIDSLTPGGRPFTSTGPNSWWYGQDSTGDYDTGSANSGDLISPSYDITSGQALTFWSWEQTENDAGYDTRKVYISTDNGANWAEIKTLYGTENQWYKVDNINLADYAGQTVRFKFTFDTVDDLYNNYEGWYIDDVEVTIPDSDGDGIPDDGDSSGTAGDNPCTGGQTTNCDDNCMNTPNPDQADADNDGVGDVCDNCSQTANSGQQDTDGDLYGNMCDCDLDNDGFVGPSDFNIFKEAWWSSPTSANWNADADFDSDDFVGPPDFNIFKARWWTSEPWE